MSRKATQVPRIRSARSEDQPATRKMLTLVRDELKSDVRSLGRRMDGRFEKVDSEIRSMRMDMESRFEELKAKSSRMELLLEEQNANNHIVLEGLQLLGQRQERLEERVGGA